MITYQCYQLLPASQLITADNFAPPVPRLPPALREESSRHRVAEGIDAEREPDAEVEVALSIYNSRLDLGLL